MPGFEIGNSKERITDLARIVSTDNFFRRRRIPGVTTIIGNLDDPGIKETFGNIVLVKDQCRMIIRQSDRVCEFDILIY